MIRLEIQKKLLSGNVWQRLHWAERKKEQEEWYACIRYANPQIKWSVPEKRMYRVTIIRIAPRFYDHDGFVAGCKEQIIDQIKSVRRKKVFGKMMTFENPALIYDDNAKYLYPPTYRQEKGKPERLIIEIE